MLKLESFEDGKLMETPAEVCIRLVAAQSKTEPAETTAELPSAWEPDQRYQRSKKLRFQDEESLVADCSWTFLPSCCVVGLSFPALREVQTGTTAADRGVCASGGCRKSCNSKASKAEQVMGELLNHGPQVLIQVIVLYPIIVCSKRPTESIQGRWECKGSSSNNADSISFISCGFAAPVSAIASGLAKLVSPKFKMDYAAWSLI